MAIIITTPRPPLNLFEVSRVEVLSAWTTIYEVPYYFIPVNGPNPARTLEAAAIMTGVLITPLVDTNAYISMRVLDANSQSWPIANDLFVPKNDFLAVSLDRQILRSGERLQMQVEAGQSAFAHFSFILNQREEFTVIA
jgi:hypothetical protein